MYVSVCLIVCIRICLSNLVCLSNRLYTCLSLCLSNRLYGCLSVCLSNRLYVCLSVCLSNRLYVCLSVCLSNRLNGCLSVCLPKNLISIKSSDSRITIIPYCSCPYLIRGVHILNKIKKNSENSFYENKI